MTNTLKDTMTTVKAELLGYKYITDFDYNSLLEMKLDYMNKKDKSEWDNVMSIELVNILLHHLTFSCNVQKDNPSIFILLEANGYKLLIDNDSFRHLSKSLDTAFEVITNREDDKIVIIYNSIINNLKSILYHSITCISDSTIDVKRIRSNTNNELLVISKTYLNIENDLAYIRDEIYYRDNKKFTLENSIIVADDVKFNYFNGSEHKLEGYNIKCGGSKIVMYLDKDSNKIGSKIIHNNNNTMLHVWLRGESISYEHLCSMITSMSYHSIDKVTIYYYGESNTGWLVIKPMEKTIDQEHYYLYKDVDFILTSSKLLNSIRTLLKRNKIYIPDTMSIYSANDMLELMYKLIKISDDKQTILQASDIKIKLNSYMKNSMEKFDYKSPTES